MNLPTWSQPQIPDVILSLVVHPTRARPEISSKGASAQLIESAVVACQRSRFVRTSLSASTSMLALIVE